MDDVVSIDLRVSPEERWTLPETRVEHLRELADYYMHEMGADASLAKQIHDIAAPLIPQTYLGELGGLSRAAGLSVSSLLLVNVYYDLVKAGMACSAFAVDTPNGPLHARNLDWASDRPLLDRTTLVTRFHGAPAGDFVTVGWPGFVGALSGMAPGRFAITLNAVFSPEPLRIALPVVFLIRQVLEDARDFGEAVERLSREPIPCDCLLLVTGTQTGEMVVIERTPSRFALRGPEKGMISVTNNYRALSFEYEDGLDELMITSCGRYERLMELVDVRPTTLEGCFGYLSDPCVRMAITVQQMAFRARDGAFKAAAAA